MQDKWVLTIDPSIRNLGWSFFFKQGRRKVELIESGHLRTTKKEREKWGKKEWEGAVDAMIDKVWQLVTSMRACHPGNLTVLIEMCAVYGGGRGTVASASEAVLKLGCFTYALRQMLKSELNLKVVLVGVRQWKGTVPKHITMLRARKHWDWKGTDHNEADAIGLGTWWFRKQKTLKK